jgi:hypothetical protein
MKLTWVQSCLLALVTGLPLSPTNQAAEADPYPFFPFCIDWHDSRKRTFPEQAEMLKELGYGGVGHIWLEKVPESLDAA